MKNESLFYRLTLYLAVVLCVFLTYNILKIKPIIDTKIIVYEKKAKDIEIKGKIQKSKIDRNEENVDTNSKNVDTNNFDDWIIKLKPKDGEFVVDWDKTKLPKYMSIDDVITTYEKDYLQAIRIGYQWKNVSNNFLCGYKLVHIKTIEFVPYVSTDFKKDIDLGIMVDYRYRNIFAGATYDIINSEFGVVAGVKVF